MKEIIQFSSVNFYSPWQHLTSNYRQVLKKEKYINTEDMNKYNSVQFNYLFIFSFIHLFMCLLSRPKANYKVNTIKEIIKIKTKQGSIVHLDNNHAIGTIIPTMTR
jgi:hypothetical protein